MSFAPLAALELKEPLNSTFTQGKHTDLTVLAVADWNCQSVTSDLGTKINIWPEQKALLLSMQFELQSPGAWQEEPW